MRSFCESGKVCFDNYCIFILMNSNGIYTKQLLLLVTEDEKVSWRPRGLSGCW